MLIAEVFQMMYVKFPCTHMKKFLENEQTKSEDLMHSRNGWVNKKMTRLAGCGRKGMLQIIKIEKLLYQLKADVNVESLFGEVSRDLEPRIGKILSKG